MKNNVKLYLHPVNISQLQDLEVEGRLKYGPLFQHISTEDIHILFSGMKNTFKLC